MSFCWLCAANWRWTVKERERERNWDREKESEKRQIRWNWNKKQKLMQQRKSAPTTTTAANSFTSLYTVHCQCCANTVLLPPLPPPLSSPQLSLSFERCTTRKKKTVSSVLWLSAYWIIIFHFFNNQSNVQCSTIDYKLLSWCWRKATLMCGHQHTSNVTSGDGTFTTVVVLTVVVVHRHRRHCTKSDLHCLVALNWAPLLYDTQAT